MPKVTGICEDCGKEFEYYSIPSRPEQRYCSRTCWSASRRIITVCPACGKEFWYNISWPRIHCSRECAGKTSIQNIRHFQPNPKRTVQCDNCGASFKKDASAIAKTDHHFCSQKCFGKWLSKTRKGLPRPEVAGPRLDLRKRVKLRCQYCGREYEIKLSLADNRKYCSIKCCNADWVESGKYTGENNHNWKGGYESYYGPNWQNQRYEARQRDNYTCQQCGVTEDELGCQLDIHHKIPFRELGLERYEEANILDNLVSLCKKCHSLLQNGGAANGQTYEQKKPRVWKLWAFGWAVRLLVFSYTYRCLHRPCNPTNG